MIFKLFFQDEECPTELNAFFDAGNFLDANSGRFPDDPCSSWESEL
jgi:hypothetical protein